ncbi:MAG TPA: BTAD domain-containing putative transcriptional regulator [Anaerolineaceae bacterium]|nr:BTAD domain-containing putative transcriptional regulator [Anaerolineaceae bacterium]HPN52009.1 BTAD domain-containing putative transcriptional regulator [Anaerolineaceae bacterium]
MPRGQFGLSLAADEEALAIIQKESLLELIWAPLTTKSWVCYLSGQLERSAAYLRELQKVALSGSLAEGWEKCIAGCLALESGDMEGARIGFGASKSIGETIGSPELSFYARLGIARLNRWEGKPAAGEEWALDARKIAQNIGYRHLEGMAQLECGRCAWQKGSLDLVDTYLQRALEILAPLQAHLELAQASLLLAALKLAQGSAEAEETAFRALEMIHAHGFHFMLDQERSFAYPVVAAVLGHRRKTISGLAVQLLEMLEKTDPPPLRVATLGGLQVWQGSRQVERKVLTHRKAGELLALLLVSPKQRLSVEEAAECLWPDREAETAAALLHQATSALRRALEPELPARFPSRYLRVEDGMVHLLCRFTRDAGSWLDFAAFESACKERDWELALKLFHGQFLPDLSDREWVMMEQQRLSVLYQNALLEAAGERLKDGMAAEALEACRKLLTIEPWQEQAVLTGMKAAQSLGDLATARRLYLTLEKTLKQELGVEPHSDLQIFYRTL